MMNRDFAMTENGDLDLGAPRVNNENQILYYHKEDLTVDTKPIKNGIEGVMIRDLVYTTGRETIKQVVFNRLKTDAPDWYHHPAMGGNLSDLIGESNTRETGDLGCAYILNALTYSGMLSMKQVSVRATPISDVDIMFLVTIAIDTDSIYRIPIQFSLENGLKE